MEEVIFRFIYSGRNPSSFFIKDIKVSVPPYEPVKGIYEALMKKGPNQDSVPDWQLLFAIIRNENDTPYFQQVRNYLPN